MLRWRLLLGLGLVAGFAALFWLDLYGAFEWGWTHGTVLLPLGVVLALLASGELMRLLDADAVRPTAWIVYAGNTAIVIGSAVPFWFDWPVDRFTLPFACLAGVLLAALAVEIWRYETPGAAIQRVSSTLFCVTYVGLLLSFVVQMRSLGEGRFGVVAVVSLIVVVKASDIGAYTTGRLFGRHKLAPRLSPGKTIEGALGGLVFAVAASWLSLRVLSEWLLPSPIQVIGTTADWIVYGVLMALAGILGDLAESLLKRDVGRKDSSDWMPGFGGVLDLLDSLLFAAPVAYGFWVYRVTGF